MRVFRTFLANWRERAPYVTAWRRYARGRVAVRWHRVPWPQRAWESWQDTRRAERIAGVPRRGRVALQLRFTWNERLRALMHGLAFEAGRGFAAGFRLPELEAELAATRTNARVYEDQWRLTNEDLRRARVCQRQAEEYAIELQERVDRLHRDPETWVRDMAAPSASRKRRWWQLWR